MARTTPVHSGYTILNGTGTGSNGSRIDVWAEYCVLSQNVAANTSNVQVYFYAALREGQSSNTSYDSGMNSSLTVNGVAGTGVSNAAYDFRSASNLHLLGSFNANITHDGDGSKSITVQGSFSTRSSYISGGTLSATLTLPTIPRASGVSCAASAQMGGSLQVTISAKSTAFTHSAVLTFGGATQQVNGAAGQSSVSIPLPLSLAQQVPNSTNGQGTITLYTYSGSTHIGTATATVMLTVPESVKPTAGSLSITRIDGSVPAAWGVYVQGKSRARATLSGSAGSYGSSISRYTLQGAGNTANSATLETALLTAGTVTFTGTVRDSRGRTSDATSASITVQAYANPKLGSVNMFRCDEHGAAADEGTYLSVCFAQTISPCGGHNSATVRLRYKPTASGSWTTSDVLTAGQTTLLAGFSAAASYDLSLDITDAFTTVSHIQTLPSAARILNVNASGKGLAIGKMSEKDAFEVAWPAAFSQTPTVAGEPLLHMSQLPAMQPGVVYAMPERWKGKQVYALLTDIGRLPAAGEFVSIYDCFGIRPDGAVSTTSTPVDIVLLMYLPDGMHSTPLTPSGTDASFFLYNVSRRLQIHAVSDLSANTAVAVIKYVL